MRITPLTSILTALLISGCASLHLDGRQVAVPVWVTEGETSLRSNAVATSLEPPLTQIWDFNAGAGFGSVSPLIVDDIVLVATRKGEVHAIDLDSARRLGQTSFGESIDGTPVIADGVLFVPISWGGRALYAYDLGKGSTVWKIKGPPISAGLAVFEDMVIAADVEGVVRAYDASNGEVRWDVELGDRVGVDAAPVLVGERLIVGDDSGRVTALDVKDGSAIWVADAGAPVKAGPSATEETVFVPTTRGTLVALSVHDGALRWKYQAGNENVYIASPAVGSGEVVFGGSDGRIRSLAQDDGAVSWTTMVDGAVTAPPLITANTIYLGTMRSRLIGLSRTNGAQAWETTLEGRIKSAFAAKGQRLVVLAEPRHVYLFGISEESYATRED